VEVDLVLAVRVKKEDHQPLPDFDFGLHCDDDTPQEEFVGG
jgi:hypothetical protein